MLKIAYISFLLCWVIYLNLDAQPVQFLGEKIEITVYEKYAGVRGQYHFHNKTNQEINRVLFYPFVVNDNLPYPDSILVFQVHDEKIIPFKQQHRGILFTITILPESSAVYQVFYLQKTPACKMEYILTTTQRWKEPLNFAEYILKLPRSFFLKNFSLNPFEKKIQEEHQIYRIGKHNFMPDTNLIVEWERRLK